MADPRERFGWKAGDIKKEPSPARRSAAALRDLAAVYEGRVEAAFSDPDALQALQAEIRTADLDEYDREQLIGRASQYVVDLRHAANLAAGDDEGAGLG